MFDDELYYLLNEARPDLFVLDQTVFLSSKSALPQTGSGLVAIRETGGAGPKSIQNLVTGLPWQGKVPPANQYPTAQLTFVADTKRAARDLANTAYYIFLQVVNRFVGNSRTFYRDLRPLQEPIDANPDAKGRMRYWLNVRADKNPSLPDLEATSLVPIATPVHVASGGVFGVKLRYNMWMVVSGSPTVRATSGTPGQIPDQTLTYSPGDSTLQGLGYGELVFKASGTFNPSGAVTFATGSGQVTTGFDGIVDAAGRSLAVDPFYGLTTTFQLEA